jgi:DEAD/DEAH box helicase domain-containing protein
LPDNFGAAWNGFLRLYNLFQFIPEAYPVTSDEAVFTSYHELMGGAGASDADSKTRGVVTDEEWRRAWDEALDLALEESEALLSELREHGAPPPLMPYELTDEGKIVAQAELGWPDQRVVVLLPDERMYQSDFEQAGWTAYGLPDVQTTLDELLEHLFDGVDTSA